MPDVASAEELAKEMVLLGEGAGRHTVALVTAMDDPLGRAVGNALEVKEALQALDGEGDAELLDVTVRVTEEMCRLAGVEADVEKVLRSGAGRDKFLQMIKAQGGRVDEGLPFSPVLEPLPAPSDGFVESIDALEIGLACVELGAGRMRKEDRVDPAAGVVIEAPVGVEVRRGEPLAMVHAASLELVERVTPRLLAAWRLGSREVRRPPHVLARVDSNGVRRAD